MQKIQLIQQNPKLADGLLSQDPRMIDVLGALMGIDMQGFSREEGSDELLPGVKKADVQTEQPAAPSSLAQPPTSPPAAKVEEQVDVEMEENDDEDAKLKKEAEAEKAAGAAAYKAKDFSKAAAHFSKAWETWPKDMSFLTNLGGKRISSFFWCMDLVMLMYTAQPSTSRTVTTTSVSRRARRLLKKVAL